VGLEVGRRLAAAGHEVFGLRRSPDSGTEIERAGIKPVIGDVTQPQDWEGLPTDFDWVVNAVSSSKGGPAEYRAIYVEGTRQLLEWLRTKSVCKYVSISSTSVYAQTDGSWVDEKSATEPISETGQILVDAEKLLLNAAATIPLVLLRASGIYGPDRGHLFQQYLRGEAEISGNAQRYLNMIHRDDVAGAVIAALEHGRPGEIYNASDDGPVPLQEFFEWLAMTLNRPMPPATAAAVAARKRAITNKRIANTKLKTETSYRFKYPTFREGYASEIKRLGLA
jgi:nucleoside-diphosphate-sugar epimerase